MSHRNRNRQILSLSERLLKAAEEARLKADRLEPGKARDLLLQKAREFEAQLALNALLQTPGAPLS